MQRNFTYRKIIKAHTPPLISIEDIKMLSKAAASPFSHPNLGLIPPNADFPLWCCACRMGAAAMAQKYPKTPDSGSAMGEEGTQTEKNPPQMKNQTTLGEKKQFWSPGKAKSSWTGAAGKISSFAACCHPTPPPQKKPNPNPIKKKPKPPTILVHNTKSKNHQFFVV